MKIAILSRYQKTSERGVEVFAKELKNRISGIHQVEILSGKDSDSFSKMINGKYDIVMPLNGRMQSLKASTGRFFSGYKMIIGGHSGMGRDDIWNIAVARPDVFVALTKVMTSWAKKWARGVKIVTIGDGIELEKFNPEGEKIDLGLKKPVVLSVGALVWYKHHDLVIEAVSRLPDCSLLVVGKGPDESKLLKIGREKLGSRFKLMSIDNEQMPKIYRSADLFTLPSWDREAFGIVYLEAMASGLGIVAPNDLSRKEIIGEAGIFTDCSQISEYSEAIKKALLTNWKNLPRKKALEFSWDVIAEKYIKLFEDLKND